MVGTTLILLTVRNTAKNI